MEIKNQEFLDYIINRIKFELNQWDIGYDSENIQFDSKLYEIGLERSDVITIVCEIEDLFREDSLDIPIEEIDKFDTICDMYSYMVKILDGLNWEQFNLYLKREKNKV